MVLLTMWFHSADQVILYLNVNNAYMGMRPQLFKCVAGFKPGINFNPDLSAFHFVLGRDWY